MNTSQNLSTALNAFVIALSIKYINTGDKTIDTNIISLITVLLLSFNIIYLKKIYNRIVFWWYYTKETPFYDIDFSKFYIFNNGELTYKYSTVSYKSAIIMYNNYIKNKNYKLYHTMTISSAYYECIPFYVASDGTICYMNSNMNNNNPVLIHVNNMLECNQYLDIFVEKYLKDICFEESKENKERKRELYITHLSDNSLTLTISKNKIFNTLYFTQKVQLLNLINKFKENKMYPKCISMDNKLGILLYGPPGTGKTGTISAVANFLNRNIVNVNLSSPNIKRETIDKILKPSEYNDKIIVFDEFDCMLDVLINKKDAEKQNKNEEQEGPNWAELLAVAEDKEERKSILEMVKNGRKKKEDSIDLAYLLQKLDGFESAEGRVIIATTNHPELINPALLRPGRFDIKLCLSNCTAQMYVDIIGAFYDLDSDGRAIVERARLVEYKWSPLEVINTCLTSENINISLNKLKQ
jgi:hypothetical protein